MTVALGTTLIDLGIKGLVKKGKWARIEDGYTGAHTTLFIGAGVTRRGETFPNVDLCAEPEALLGFVIGLNTAHHELPSQGPWYNDYDNPFAASRWIQIGIPEPEAIYLVLSATNTTIVRGNKLKCVDGVWAVADTNDNYQMIAEEPVTGAADTRKYFYAKWVKN